MSSQHRLGLWKGGRRQRRSRSWWDLGGEKHANASSASGTVPAGPLEGDPESRSPIELWGLGLLSATTLQHIGVVANRVASRPQVDALALLGTYGAYPASMHRVLLVKAQLRQGRCG